MLEYKRTNGKNNDFIENCRRLDVDLDQRVLLETGEKLTESVAFFRKCNRKY
ncbi:MAG: hypothetical protein PUH29_09130 [Lachnospiraceae bacterium]|nr:hypothetical protein [Lachnospiraceae bacterium]